MRASLGAQGPEFKPQHHQKRKKNSMEYCNGGNMSFYFYLDPQNTGHQECLLIYTILALTRKCCRRVTHHDKCTRLVGDADGGRLSMEWEEGV
jgi:hypothetical protein